MDHVTDVDAVRRPIHEAHGLPNAHYIDPSIYDEEKHAVLFSGWAGLGVGAEVPEIGDAVPHTFLGIPLLLLRDKTGKVRVFQNTCRHRGMILVEEPRKIEGAIRCPYHSWCYSTEGRLVSTPHVGGPGQNTHDGIDRALLGLIEIRCYVWMDVVWINISGDAPEFVDANAELVTQWADFDKPLFHGGEDSTFQLTLDCNWKLAVENYCESYHLPWIHPGLNSYSRLEDHYHIEVPEKYSGQGTWVYRQLRDDAGNSFPDFGGIDDKWDTAAEYISVFPNVLMGVHRDHTFAIVLTPEGPEKTIENIHLYYAAPKTDSNLRAQNTEQWKLIFNEDVFVVEGMQRGRHAPQFDGGRFSPAMDGPTHLFHDWVASKLQTHRNAKMAAE
ncbi:MAG: aromatic ring-hydroxylating dioxygenase subunit alpha [Rhodobacteraceae bacterium]|jgi:phenylpropionate dioxygenase-like ring-hydroxylating dioxygenase large terminal subunit|nr:aromatic ring-hydroxylating dioxygenase subunit alpha [Paracoccaceae bacterium]